MKGPLQELLLAVPKPKSMVILYENADMMTIYGPAKFKACGVFQRQNQLSTLALQVKKGKFEIVRPKDRSTADPIYPVPRWSER